MGFAEALRALMDERGISGRALARKVPCDQALVSRYLSGKQEPSTKMAQLFDDALGAEGALVGLAKPGRRAVLTGGLLAGALMTISPETLERLAWAERHPPQIDAAVVESLADVLAAQRRADDAVGAAALLRPTLAQLGSV
jgi:transcriptional regulator with XRE-family HTH domain